MKIVPVIKSGDLERSVQSYTRVLDFERKWPGHEEASYNLPRNTIWNHQIPKTLPRAVRLFPPRG
jgi:hypothetical protein